MKERTNYLIMVLCEDVSMEDMENNMRLYLKTNTYLPRDSHWFWDKLRLAMPKTPLSVLLERLGCRRESECPLMEAVVRDQFTTESVTGPPTSHRCTYRGPGTEEVHPTESQAPPCCQHDGPKSNIATDDKEQRVEVGRI